jgi:hypothetical protein
MGRSIRSGRGVVEDCLVLSVTSVCRGYGSGRRDGVVQWRCGDQDIGAIRYEINLWSSERGSLWLWYAAYGKQMCHAISMTSTTLHSGGRRWWFVCPVTGERVGKLYLPDGATHFAGRKAHDLTYTSCRESGRFKRLRRKIDKLLGRDETLDRQHGTREGG